MSSLFCVTLVMAQDADNTDVTDNNETMRDATARPRRPLNNHAHRNMDATKAYRDLAYTADAHPRQTLDLFVPEQSDGPVPLIIWVHGGGWAAGSKDSCPPLRSGYTQRGYAVASIGYRLSGDAVFPAQIEDCKAAVRWLRAHSKQYNLDSEHFAAWGSSAGGHLVALLGTSGHETSFDVGDHLDQSSRVQAVCDYYGPTDLLQMDSHAIPSAVLKHNSPRSPESRLIGGPILENKDKAARVNPIPYITKDAPPFLIVHGDQDPTVAHHQSQLLYNALKEAGVRVRFHTLEGAGHGNGFGGPELDAMVQGFFDQHLKGKSPSDDQPIAIATSSPAVNRNPNAKPSARVPQTRRPLAEQRSDQRRGIPWQVIERREDSNSDGRVSRSEFKGPPILFNRLDRNGDGNLTQEDFADDAGERDDAKTSEAVPN
ncbi:alpha/beta hydrolase [Rubripirellula amarantea]|nr:alpha/beta hydrolase [Rubripirellula amarantea]